MPLPEWWSLISCTFYGEGIPIYETIYSFMVGVVKQKLKSRIPATWKPIVQVCVAHRMFRASGSLDSNFRSCIDPDNIIHSLWEVSSSLLLNFHTKANYILELRICMYMYTLYLSIQIACSNDSLVACTYEEFADQSILFTAVFNPFTKVYVWIKST